MFLFLDCDYRRLAKAKTHVETEILTNLWVHTFYCHHHDSISIAGCAKVQAGYKKETDVVQQIKYKGLRIDSVIYGTLIFVSLTEVKSAGLVPNKVVLTTLLKVYVKRRLI
ncbi:unnamed protein product [Lactuca virosa]|uniref:Uncharacterized protein n=1 Tax=Lactuca virosa TaxID=75947 RepID=A0AAU9NJS9_9ASTR|nr:unnamed protein product [Lactuca virosa]